MTTLTQERTRREDRRFARLRAIDRPPAARAINAAGLARALAARVRGEVRFDDGSRALYATDGSNYRQVPIGVVLPRDLEDVIHTVATAREFGAPVFSRGGGTSLAGQSCNVAVLMDFSKYLHRVLEIDPTRRLGRVEPGCVLDDLRNAAQVHGLTFGPDPATHTHCTLGGMLGNNSCGIHSLLCAKHGIGLRTSDNTHELLVLTYDGLGLRVGATPEAELDAIIRAGGRRGEIYAQLKALRDRYADVIRRDMPKLPRRVSGYGLDELLPENGFNVARALVGPESTCVTILEATLHLVPAPKARSLLILGYPDVYTAADQVPEILPHKPTGLEGMDRCLFDWVRAKGDHDADIALLPPGGGWLLVEFGGESKQDSDQQARALMDQLKRSQTPPSMKLFDDPSEEERIWKVREGGLGSTAWVPGHPDTWEGWEDSAVPPDKVGAYLRDFNGLLDRYGYETSLYGHFGQGCVHCRIPFDLYTAEGIRKFRAFLADASDLIVKYGGSFSGEHGDGQSRAELLPKLFGPELMQAFREFKAIWDPEGRMNPGKVVDPYPITSNLRLGSDYNPPSPPTYFRYPGDRGTFARAALRCVGVGECRREGGGVMCPSYMATREEMHSTRGRARLLWEMLNGEVVADGWRSEPVREALDLCLACKGCKHDCPVNVDMATYKAEFLAHYYAGRLRPRHAYAFGWVHPWVRYAALAPAMFNFVNRAPLLADVAKWASGMARNRRAPALAPERFKRWFRRRGSAQRTGTPVVLWADTFNDFFHPETAQAAVEVLERGGFRVLVPRAELCCGRPLYDYGFLDAARRWLGRILQVLRPAVQRGLPVVVLEPSCAAVFRDELPNLYPNDEDARRLAAQVHTLDEFLVHHAPDFPWPEFRGTAVLHGHCHHKSVLQFPDEEAALRRLGLELQTPELGCCGMAGAFGFESGDHYQVSMACSERALLPAVRAADDATLIIADGFSCREQIAQGTDRTALHLANVLALAFAGEAGSRTKERPEAALLRRRRAAARRANLRAAAVMAGALGTVGAGALWWRSR
ncbi:MAG TPA: FAD-binding and (Fe-S)-binding domain-containing protein [Gemmatimonadales bacterium]|nr:FAD-binding and (Fe-S)-binding domain-containing protein [Gemmatimonadales bacterium]